MKRRFIRVIGVFLLMAIVFVGWRQGSRYKLRVTVEETRRQLRTEGFKTELRDFSLTPSPELQQRAYSIAQASTSIRNVLAFSELRPMQRVGAHIARSSAVLPFIPTDIIPSGGAQVAVFLRRYSEEGQAASPAQHPLPDNLWDLLAAELLSNQESLLEASRLIAEGPFGFGAAYTNGHLHLHLQFLPNIDILASALSAQALLAFHENRQADAFTNLLTLTQLITHWRIEPVGSLYQGKFVCAERAFQSLWEALQTDDWSDKQLEILQNEWERAEFFAGLPETPAFERALMVQQCRDFREQSFASQFGGWSHVYRQIIGSFRFSVTNGVRTLRQLGSSYQKFSAYRDTGSYKDENDLLIYYRDLEIELKSAPACTTWMQMRSMISATNGMKFATGSPMRSMLNPSMVGFNTAHDEEHVIARAAKSETRRRLAITAIALKRFQLRHGHNPETLSELVPHQLQSLPLDFMDGKQLRYQRFEDGRFLLYSTGLDCTDNGGCTRVNDELPPRHPVADNSVPVRSWLNNDILWPMRATKNEILIYETSQEKTLRRRNRNWF